MKVWVVVFDCGDYYCEGDHIAGIYTDEPQANTVVTKLGGLDSYPLYVKLAVWDVDREPDLSEAT